MAIEGGPNRFWPEVMRLDNSVRGGIQPYAEKVMEVLELALCEGEGVRGRLKELRIIAFWNFDERVLQGAALAG